MWEDPIVAEVHRIREKLAAEHNYDIAAFFADLRKRQAALGSRLVRPKNQPNMALQPTAPVTSVSQGSESLETPSDD
jgi:hypothetical protein